MNHRRQSRSKSSHKPIDKNSIYQSAYSISTNDGITEIIAANEILLGCRLNLTTREFRKLYEKQDGKCPYTGTELKASYRHSRLLKSVLGIGIKHDNKYELTVFPYAYTCKHHKKQRMQELKLSEQIIEKYPISHIIYQQLLQRLSKSSILDYPIEIRFDSMAPRLIVSTIIGDSARNSSIVCFQMTIMDNIIMSILSDKQNTYEHKYIDYKIDLGDPSIDMIEESMKIMLKGIKISFPTLASSLCQFTDD